MLLIAGMSTSVLVTDWPGKQDTVYRINVDPTYLYIYIEIITTYAVVVCGINIQQTTDSNKIYDNYMMI